MDGEWIHYTSNAKFYLIRQNQSYERHTIDFNESGGMHLHCLSWMLEALVDKKEFADVRKKINKTQKQMAELLGTSVKAIHSYEQGWRSVPGHVERQLFFIISRMRHENYVHKPCWIIKECPTDRKKRCPAWEFKAGELCWLINGTICEGSVQKNWHEKMKICRSCEVLTSLL